MPSARFWSLFLGAAGEVDESVTAVYAMQAATHDDDAVLFCVQFGEDEAEGVVNRADELARLDFL